MYMYYNKKKQRFQVRMFGCFAKLEFIVHADGTVNPHPCVNEARRYYETDPAPTWTMSSSERIALNRYELSIAKMERLALNQHELTTSKNTTL